MTYLNSPVFKKFLYLYFFSSYLGVCPKNVKFSWDQFSSVAQLYQLVATPWTAAHQASLCITNSRSLFKLMSIELVMPSNHLILCRPLLLLPSIFPSIRIFSNESVLSQHQDLFKWVSSLHQAAKVLEFQLQHQSFQWIFRTNFL